MATQLRIKWHAVSAPQGRFGTPTRRVFGIRRRSSAHVWCGSLGPASPIVTASQFRAAHGANVRRTLLQEGGMRWKRKRLPSVLLGLPLTSSPSVPRVASPKRDRALEPNDSKYRDSTPS
eukprot:1836843-Rhodomonas_salina.1